MREIRKGWGTNSSACLNYIRFWYLGITTNFLLSLVRIQAPINQILETTTQIKWDKLEAP